MKVLKKATQQNILLNEEYYTLWEVEEMLLNKECFYISESNFNECYSYEEYCQTYRRLRIFTEHIEEIKVVYNKNFECYETVAIGKNGKTYHVEL